MWQAIEEVIASHLGRSFRVEASKSVSGGCIHEAYRVSDSLDAFFVKRHAGGKVDMFASEYRALEAMHATRTLRVPSPIAFGEDEEGVWLVMEFVDMQSCPPGSQHTLGRQLAELHTVEQPFFGWHVDNTIGSTPQPNPRSSDWIDFWCEQRLGWLLSLVQRQGHAFHHGDRVMDGLASLFEGYSPRPSLLHGDLWYGNMAALGDGTPIVFDPASYYGDAEAEFGIMDMFGGFTQDFYRGYASVRPFDDGFQDRLHLYRLYHELNHLYLFGASYASSCESSLRKLAALLDAKGA